MMNLRNKILAGVVASLLYGCGSDDPSPNNAVPDNTEITIPSTASVGWNYVETPYREFDPEVTSLKGDVHVNLGRMNDRVTVWVGDGLALASNGDLSRDLNGDNAVNARDAAIAGIVNDDFGPSFNVQATDMREWLSQNLDGLGAGTARPDIFVAGHYSVFDLLRYVVGTREDLRWEGGVESIIHPEDSEFDTFEYRISYDANADKSFDEADGEYFNSGNWHFALLQSLGQNKHFAMKGHTPNYRRIDSYYLREQQRVRFTPFSDEMTKRRQWVFKQEVNRLAEHDGKYVVPLLGHLLIEDYRNRDPNAFPDFVGQNLEVKAFNMRPDVYQPGVITFMDIWLSYAEQYDADIRFTWWEKMSSGAIARGFAMMHNPWIGPFGGWFASAPIRGELATANDFQYFGAYCPFNEDGSPTADGSTGIDTNTCIKDWTSFNAVGGVNLGELEDNLTATHPPQYVGLVSVDAGYLRNANDIDLHKGHKAEVYVAENELQHTILNNLGDFSLYPTSDVVGTATLRTMYPADAENKVGNATVLSESHFGWKIADCTQCHNEDKDPQGHGGSNWPVNNADGFDYIQPYYCATCHGSNGAQDGHNRGARCFWCHNTNNSDFPKLNMKNHGDSSISKFIPKELNVANQRTASSAMVDDNGEHVLYDDLWNSSYNSDYSLSRKFPDPFSCAACHGFEHELAPKVGK